jgi:uncharacterized protein YjiS (DUF1127 family)
MAAGDTRPEEKKAAESPGTVYHQYRYPNAELWHTEKHWMKTGEARSALQLS